MEDKCQSFYNGGHIFKFSSSKLKLKVGIYIGEQSKSTFCPFMKQNLCFINTVGLRGKQNIFQIGDFMALGSSFRYDQMPLSLKRLQNISRDSKKARKVWDSNPRPQKDPFCIVKRTIFKVNFHTEHVGVRGWDQDSNQL